MREITAERQVLTLEEYVNKYFPVVKASTLSLDSEFLKHEPENELQVMLKFIIVSAITSNLSDFRAQVMDPSLDENGRIFYQSGMKPAIGKSANWWKANAELFIPEKESRLGNIKERAAYLGVLIEHLVQERQYPISIAWRAVCNNSKDLANYLDSPNSKAALESTGSRKIDQWYDWGNTYKIITIEPMKFLLTSGWSFTYAKNQPLASIDSYDFPNVTYGNSVGWIVLPKV